MKKNKLNKVLYFSKKYKFLLTQMSAKTIKSIKTAANILRRGSDGIAAPLHNSSNGGQGSGEEQQQYGSDIHDELDELFRQDPQQVKDEIRKFISERHISQSAIAKATRNGL